VNDLDTIASMIRDHQVAEMTERDRLQMAIIEQYKENAKLMCENAQLHYRLDIRTAQGSTPDTVMDDAVKVSSENEELRAVRDELYLQLSSLRSEFNDMQANRDDLQREYASLADSYNTLQAQESFPHALMQSVLTAANDFTVAYMASEMNDAHSIAKVTAACGRLGTAMAALDYWVEYPTPDPRTALLESVVNAARVLKCDLESMIDEHTNDETVRLVDELQHSLDRLDAWQPEAPPAAPVSTADKDEELHLLRAVHDAAYAYASIGDDPLSKAMRAYDEWSMKPPSTDVALPVVPVCPECGSFDRQGAHGAMCSREVPIAPGVCPECGAHNGAHFYECSLATESVAP
jgi:regulator of replication initiation timing